LTGVGLGRDAFQVIVHGTLEEAWTRTNPRKIESGDDIATILEAML